MYIEYNQINGLIESGQVNKQTPGFGRAGGGGGVIDKLTIQTFTRFKKRNLDIFD